MGVLFTNNASTTLSAAISSTSATSISVASSSTFPAPGAGEYFYATIDDTSNIEIVKVTAVSGTTWTVVRGADNTTAATFANGTTVQLRAAAALLTDIQQNIAAKSANQTVYNATTASSATAYDVGTNPQNENNAMVFLDGVMQHHDTFSFSGSTLTFDAAPSNGLKLEVIIDNLINLQSSNLTVDTFTATNGQTAFTLSDTPAAEDNLIVFIEGVFQNQDSYTISNNVLTMSAGVTTGRKVVVYVINPVNIGTPSDGTVTSAKLSGNITMPGTLTVGSNDVAFDSPTFVVDNANSRVGLGTASPSVPVDIVGDVKMSSTLDLTSHLDMPDNAYIKLGTGDDLLIYHDASHSYIEDDGTGDLRLKGSTVRLQGTGGTNLLVGSTGGATSLYHNNATKLATASGGVTVTGTLTATTLAGTLSTAAQTNITSLGTLTGLTVDGATTTNALKGGSTNFDIYQTTSDGSDNRRTRIGGGGDVAQSRGAFIELAGNEHSDTGDLILNAGDVSGGDILLKTDNTTRIFVKDDGKVGVGTTSPNSKLEVLDTSGATITLNRNDTTIAVDDLYGGVDFWDADGGGTSAGVTSAIRSYGESAVGASSLRFYTSNSSGGNRSSLTEAMRVHYDGKVGIGTSSPAKKLEVAVTGANQASTVRIQGTDGNSNGHPLDLKMDGASDSFSILIGQGGGATPDVVLFNGNRNGNVGIGTTSPDSTLHVDGSDVVGRFNSSSGAVKLRFQEGGTARAFVGTLNGSNGFAIFGSDGTTERVRVDSNGKVGIGTTSPFTPLHVSTEGAPNTSGDVTSGFVVSDGVGGPAVKIGVHNTGALNYLQSGYVNNIQVARNFAIFSGATEAIRIDTSGNLLVGTTSTTIGTSNFGAVIFADGRPKVSKNVSGASHVMNVYGNAGEFRVFGDGDVLNTNNSYGQISDVSLKENIVDATDKLNEINQIKVRNFNFIGDDLKQIGVIAQELETIFPSMVKTDEEEDIKTVKYSVFVPILIKALQEADDKIDALEARITELESS